MPAHKGKGKVSNNGIKCDDLWMQALTHHYEYLLNLGEVRAMRVVATLVDRVQGHANQDKGTVDCDEVTVDMIHLPMMMGYRNCYKRYMASLDYNLSSTAQEGLIVTGVGGKAVDSREYVSLTTYYYKWKQLYPHLKVSRPVEDICQYCYALCNRHRYLANHSLFGVDGDGNEDEEELLINLELEEENAAVDDGGVVNDATGSVGESAEDQPDSFAANSVAEKREQLLFESAEHIKMAWVQRALYLEKVAAAVKDAEGGVLHSERRYTFVVDYG